MLVVTGANGFIGSAMVCELNQAGRTDIICVDHITPEERPAPLSRLQYSHFCKPYDLEQYIQQNQLNISGLFHIGACSSTTETDEAYLKKNNTEYSKDMCRIATEQDCPFIYASSAATYGDGTKGFDDHSDPETLKPLNLYGWSKLWFDQWSLKQERMPNKWYGLRYFNVYGPNEYHKSEMASVVYKAYLQIKDTGSLKLFRSHNPDYKDGEQLRDFVYVKDVTRWMLELLTADNIKNGIYNFGFGQCRSWVDLATNVFKTMGEPVNINWIDIPENIRNQYQYFTEANMTKLSSQNMTAPEWSLEKGINDYLTNYLLTDQPNMGGR